MIGPSNKFHQRWQWLNRALCVAVLGAVFLGLTGYALWSVILVLLISAVLEARFDKRSVNWRF